MRLAIVALILSVAGPGSAQTAAQPTQPPAAAPPVTPRPPAARPNVQPASKKAPASPAQSLALGDVLRNLVNTHPKIVGAAAKVRAKRGKQLATRSRFEPKVKANGLWLPSGFYEYRTAKAEVEQFVPDTSIAVRGGYRYGRGNIPDYYGELDTRTGGEFFASINVPLLRNRAIDAERAAIQKATLDITKTDFQRQFAVSEITRDATHAYWAWVSSGQKLRIQRELLDIARQRANFIREQVDSGARPRITLVDAERVLNSRNLSVLKADASFAKAQAKLSLYLRTPESVPIMAPVDAVPKSMDAPAPPDASKISQYVDGALSRRADVLALDVKMRELRVEKKEARNHGIPALDFRGYVARDVGRGSETLAQTDVGLGLQLSVPLFRRKARGELRRVRNEMATLQATRRGLRDRIAADLRQSLLVAQLSAQRLQQATQQVIATQRLADAERLRLQQGASDILVVNLRELDVAAAAREAIDAALAANKAYADFLFASAL